MRRLFPILLFALGAAAPAGAIPDRDAVAIALLERLCGEGGADCPVPLEIDVSNLDCRAEATEEQPTRVLCNYVVGATEPDGERDVGIECAYFIRDPGSRWRVFFHPDADVCES